MSKNSPNLSATAGVLIALAVQVVPAAYVAITGRAPTWVRLVLAFWLISWALYMVIRSERGTR